MNPRNPRLFAALVAALLVASVSYADGVPIVSRMVGEIAPAPVMTPPLMRLLINATRHAGSPGLLSEKISRNFGLGAGTIVLPIEVAQAETANDCRSHFFALSLMSARDDVVIFREYEDGIIEAYLTDAGCRLRAAVTLEAGGTLHRINQFKAAMSFNAELSLIASEVQAVVKETIAVNTKLPTRRHASAFNVRFEPATRP